ncbi:MAG: hypothetical protein JEZ08_01655 [Clostridiales bacterium]|nr:hypothetical protein [Clostridiales bacterium]
MRKLAAILIMAILVVSCGQETNIEKSSLEIDAYKGKVKQVTSIFYRTINGKEKDAGSKIYDYNESGMLIKETLYKSTGDITGYVDYKKKLKNM